ncbi:MAG: 3-phosphoserine/phosphohydroxythreonine transaminase [Pseudomonadota bacterium]
MRPHNFSAGPAGLPEAVLERARAELLDFRGSGASVMELSHRGPVFMQLVEEIEARLRALMAVPDEYAVLFFQGGATLQFSTLVWNLIGDADGGDYVVTGLWSDKAQRVASALCEARVACSTQRPDGGFDRVPAPADIDIDPDAAWLHYCPNETVHGIEFPYVPDAGAVPLVADYSSSILSQPVDVSRFGVLYAGAQKNLGPAGITLVIVRRDLIRPPTPGTPAILSYAGQAGRDSMLNTPPTFAWYLLGLVLEWVEEQGGAEAMATRSQRKADTLYSAIDASNYYTNAVALDSRSRVNVTFDLAEPERVGAFVAAAESAGLLALKGHSAVGGLRASLYNAVSQQAVDDLVAFMTEFERTRG